MKLKRVRNAAYTDDDPPIVRALRFATEPQPRPWGPFLTGYGVFAVVLGALTISTLGPPRPEKPKPHQITRLFVPARRTESRDHPPEKKRLVSKETRPAVPPPIDLPPVNGKVDLSAIEISVLSDSSNQLPEVMRQQRGTLALVERSDQAVAHYTFEPPDWKMNDEITDVSGRIRFSISPPFTWDLLRSLSGVTAIQMEKYQVDALFDGGYARCLEQEIRKRADAEPNPGRVKAAVLVFTSSRSCGIDVVNLEYTGR